MNVTYLFSLFSNLAAHLTELAAVLVVTAAITRGLWQGLRLFVLHAQGQLRGRQQASHKQGLQLWLGSRLVLALELELAADVLRTAVHPSWQAFLELAAIAVLRTLLSYVLQRELPRKHPAPTPMPTSAKAKAHA